MKANELAKIVKDKNCVELLIGVKFEHGYDYFSVNKKEFVKRMEELNDVETGKEFNIFQRNYKGEGKFAAYLIQPTAKLILGGQS